MSGDDTLQLPRAGMPVTLVVDDLRVRARVERSGGELELSVPMAPAPLRRPGGFDVRLEFVGERGPCRLLGTAMTMLADASGDPRVRFEPQGNPQLLLISEKVRAPVELEIEVDAGAGAIKRRTRDMRGNGALVAGPLALEVEAEVGYRLRLPGRTSPVEGRARVARITDDGDVALQLLELGEGDYDEILLATLEAQRSR
jgi:hypothetical protein